MTNIFKHYSEFQGGAFNFSLISVTLIINVAFAMTVDYGQYIKAYFFFMTGVLLYMWYIEKMLLPKLFLRSEGEINKRVTEKYLKMVKR